MNREYAAHQQALMAMDDAADAGERNRTLSKASQIAGRIGTFQHGLGAAAACAWSTSQCAKAALAKG